MQRFNQALRAGTLEGRGKREPLAIEERERYSLAQVYQLLRRVELVQ